MKSMLLNLLLTTLMALSIARLEAKSLDLALFWAQRDLSATAGNQNTLHGNTAEDDTNGEANERDQ
jgi:hypothetical protein